MLKWKVFNDATRFSNMSHHIPMPEFVNKGVTATRVRFLNPDKWIRGGWHFSFITISYADGSRLNANFSKRGITQIHWMTSKRKGRTFEIHVGEAGREKVLIYDVESVGEGDDEDMKLSNIRQYEGDRLVREYPAHRLGEMIFERKIGKSPKNGLK